MNNQDLAQIGALALKEHKAWEVRNKARNELRRFMRKYQDETGEWFSSDEAEPEDVAAFDALQKTAKDAQRALTAARCATRRKAKKLRSNMELTGGAPTNDAKRPA